ncbi:MAG: hypothetical protein JOZ22_11660, partial [Acidobacteriia bacterium]|nr:hypothetical protein [Terriglobia bacterium]
EPIGSLAGGREIMMPVPVETRGPAGMINGINEEGSGVGQVGLADAATEHAN